MSTPPPTRTEQRNMRPLSYSERLFRKVVSVSGEVLAMPGRIGGTHPLFAPAEDSSQAAIKATLQKVCDWQLKQLNRYRHGSWLSRLSALTHLGYVPYGPDHWATAVL